MCVCCVRACVRARACACVALCVTLCDTLSVCVCVCVCARARACDRAHDIVCHKVPEVQVVGARLSVPEPRELQEGSMGTFAGEEEKQIW